MRITLNDTFNKACRVNEVIANDFWKGVEIEASLAQYFDDRIFNEELGFFESPSLLRAIKSWQRDQELKALASEDLTQEEFDQALSEYYNLLGASDEREEVQDLSLYLQKQE